MYYYMDMPFESQTVAEQTLGSIKMFRRSPDRLGTAADGSDIRWRGYVLLATDISKLSNITNAAEGSEAFIADTGKIYMLCDGQWSEWTGSGGTTLKWSHV